MVAINTPSQSLFYREFLMTRGNFDPAAFGIRSSKEDFTDEMVGDFADYFRGQWTIDECLLHPRDAMRFCDEVRQRRGYWDVPDDIILRVILTRRKNPAG
jgi:hypothetical protein